MNGDEQAAADSNQKPSTGYVPDEQRIALAKAWQEVPKELKTNPQVEGAFRTGFRLGWHAREKTKTLTP